VGNHTSGPWKLYNREILGPAFDGTWKSICEKVRGGNPVEADANARLIAAAPELLNVAHAASHALKAYEYGNGSPDLARSCAAAIDEAIAKAEGR
jgi:hypothetical protein